MRQTIVGTISAGFVFLLPFITSDKLFYGPINAKFFYVLLFTYIIVGAYSSKLYAGVTHISLRKRFLLAALLLLLAVQYLASFLGVFPERSLWSDIYWSSGVLFVTHVATLAFLLCELLSHDDWRLVRSAVAYSGALFGLLTVVGVQGFGYVGRVLFINFNHSGLTLGNETYAGVYLTLALVFAVSEFTRKDLSPKIKWSLLVSVLLIGLSPLLFNLPLLLGKVPLDLDTVTPQLLLGTARSSSAAVFVLYGFLCLRFIARRYAPGRWVGRIVAGIAVVLLAGLAMLVSILFVPGSYVQNAYVAESSAARVIVWSAAWKAVQERPLFGWGPENFNFALERHFDPRLFQEENLAEIWFDRAHNVLLDTLVGSGGFGLIAGILVLVVYLSVLYRGSKQGLLPEIEAVLFAAIVPLHLLQLQTGFDTVSSYVLLAFVVGYVLSLERRLVFEQRPAYQSWYGKGAAGFFLALALISVSLIFIPEYGRQRALVETFNGSSFDEQATLARRAIGRDSSFESVRLSSATFLKGSLSLLAEKPTSQRVESVRTFMKIYEDHYASYLKDHPYHYRARMNYAYLLLVMMSLGDDRVRDAQTIIRASYALSPNNPLTYTLDSVSELYSGDLEAADRLMVQALALNPDIEFTQAMAGYLERQKRTFPNLSVLKLENL